MPRLSGLSYSGFNAGMGGQVVIVVEGDDERRLEHDVRHSPDGFQWGYGGSGPAELARCILLDALPVELADIAERVYQDFKWTFVAPSPENLLVSGGVIELWLREYAKNGVRLEYDSEKRRRLLAWLDGAEPEGVLDEFTA